MNGGSYHELISGIHIYVVGPTIHVRGELRIYL